MPRGIYIRKKEHGQKISETRKKMFASGELVSGMKGKHRTEELKLNHSNFMKIEYASGKRKPIRYWLDRKRSKETLLKQSITMREGYRTGRIIPYELGKKKSVERRNKISETLKMLYRTGKIKSTSPMKGKHHTEEQKQNLREKSTGFRHSEEAKQKIREATIRQHTTNVGKGYTYDTVPEKIVEQCLIGKGIRFFKQYSLCNITCVDFFLPGQNIALFVDGDYWHGNPEVYLELNPTQKQVSTRDSSINVILVKSGYKVMRLWEKDIKENITTLMDGVLLL